MREKTAFESISIDSEKMGISYSSKLAEYFEAFSRNDKDTEKMIQAGGYAWSFVQCLKNLQPQRFNDETLEINAIGLTDRAYNATFISKKEDMPILQIMPTLEIFQEIYREGKEQFKGIPYPEKRAISQTSVFERIFNEFNRTLKNNTAANKAQLTAFTDTLQTVPTADNDAQKVSYTETLRNFYSTADHVPTEIMAEVGLIDEKSLTFRDAHAKLITKALNDKELLLFLTGHPGIGKMTAIVDYTYHHHKLSFFSFLK
jgi:hypothetical protein